MQVQNPEQLARSRGLGLHMNASLARYVGSRLRTNQHVMIIYSSICVICRSDRYISGDLDYCLSIRNPQHRSKYGKGKRLWLHQYTLLSGSGSHSMSCV
jgi:hypothetical protein